MVFEALVASVSALGIMLLASGLYRLRRRTATSRRVASLFADSMPLAADGGLEPAPSGVSRWRLEVRHGFAVIEAHDTRLRGPTLVAACICGMLGLATASAALIGLAVLCAVAVYALGKSDRRRKRIEIQALNAMQLLASGLRAGYSVPQAIALVARRSPEPTASEFALAAQEISIGVQLADSIARLAKRTANSDYELVAIIVRVQHEVGGNLAQILDSVGNTLRERFDLRRQVNALTAQQRMSSTVLTLLPFGLLMFLFVVDRSFVEPLFTQTAGRLMLALAGVMVFTGWTVMRSIGQVEV
jgi:tight adherence protein B